MQIRFFRHVKTNIENQILTIASFTFHTGFMPVGTIRIALSDLEISKRDGNGADAAYPEHFSIDVHISGGPIEKDEPIISYSIALDASLPRCCKTLASYHSVRATESLVSQLEVLGYPRYFGTIYLI